VYFWISCLAAGVSIGLFFRFCANPVLGGQSPDARPDPVFLKMAWPWVLAAASVCRPFISWRVRRSLGRAVQLAGMDDSLWPPERIVAAQCLAALAAFAVVLASSAAGVAAGFSTRVALACVAAIICFAWPRLALRERGLRRQRAMLREFPFLLDMTTLCVEAGLNLNGALAQAARHSPSGPLRQELRYTLADMRAGVPRHDALAGLAGRTGLPALQQLATALAQADQMGMSLGPLLRSQSEQRRAERFLRAEKLALEAPVKMLFPMVFCIFPCTFLIIGFPIAMKLMAMAA